MTGLVYTLTGSWAAAEDLAQDAFVRAYRDWRRQAQAVALHYHSDLSVADVATAMGCAQGTVKAHLHAARRALAAALCLDEGSAP